MSETCVEDMLGLIVVKCENRLEKELNERHRQVCEKNQQFYKFL